MLTCTKPMQWLCNLAEEYRSILKRNVFYKTVAVAASPADFKWVRQLYHLSSDFTAAVALRYASCQDRRFRDAFGEHAAEEVEHPKELADWMREYGFLALDEDPNSVPPTLESLALGAYLIRSVMREPIAHQVITLNLLTEGMAQDFYATVNPKFASLGLTPKGYWLVHQEADIEHQLLGLDLLEPCDPDSVCGKYYARTLWEITSLWSQVFDSWSGLPIEYKLRVPTPEELALG